MPNWVTNTLTIECDNKELLAEVGARLRAPIPSQKGHTEDAPQFSFWNIIKPEDSILDEYFANADATQLHNRNNWYNWNNRNWGCKWDARVHYANAEEKQLVYEFDTAWAPPIQVIETLAETYPDLEITLRYVEEQGWGGEHWFQGHISNETETWDIPETHEEAMKVFGECYNCEQDYRFDDCPDTHCEECDNGTDQPCEACK